MRFVFLFFLFDGDLDCFVFTFITVNFWLSCFSWQVIPPSGRKNISYPEVHASNSSPQNLYVYPQVTNQRYTLNNAVLLHGPWEGHWMFWWTWKWCESYGVDMQLVESLSGSTEASRSFKIDLSGGLWWNNTFFFPFVTHSDKMVLIQFDCSNSIVFNCSLN